MSSSSSFSLAKKPKLEITTTNRNWLELPRDITSNILQRLGAVEILKNARNVCPYWWNICKDRSMWRNIHMGTFHLYSEYSVRGTSDLDRLVKMCQYAVDLSSGHLETIDIYRFGTDALLQYIAHRASNLRSLQLDSCIRISDEGLSEVAKKFPLLEEISISHGFKFKKSLEVIGLSCPLLKSLKFNQSGDYIKCDDEALIIARTMPGLVAIIDHEAFIIAKTMSGLRHLALSGIVLGVDELLDILNGCPLLDSLDLKNCVCHHQLSPSLVKRCHEQIKDLQLPTFSPDDNYDDNDDDYYVPYMDIFEDTYANEYWEY